MPHTNRAANAVKQEAALLRLLALMNQPGAEFPDVHARVCSSHKLTAREGEQLTAAYDDHTSTTQYTQ